MARCRTSIVSILNNDDNPSFAVPSALTVSRQHTQYHHPQHHQQFQPLLPPQHQQQLQQPVPDLAYRYPVYVDSQVDSPRLSRHPYDSASPAGTSLPTSPVLSDCSYDYIPGNPMSSYQHYGRQEHSYPPAFPPSQSRLPVAYPNDPPSPQSSLSGSKDLSASRGSRKNKYPCPYAVSHSCSATFTTSGHAARHGKKHTGEKSVHCPICNKAFTRKDNMKQHIRTHRTHSEEMSVPVEKEDDSGIWTRRPGPSSYDHDRPTGQPQTDRSSFHSVTGILSTTTQENHHGYRFK